MKREGESRANIGAAAHNGQAADAVKGQREIQASGTQGDLGEKIVQNKRQSAPRVRFTEPDQKLGQVQLKTKVQGLAKGHAQCDVAAQRNVRSAQVYFEGRGGRQIKSEAKIEHPVHEINVKFGVVEIGRPLGIGQADGVFKGLLQGVQIDRAGHSLARVADGVEEVHRDTVDGIVQKLVDTLVHQGQALIKLGADAAFDIGGQGCHLVKGPQRQFHRVQQADLKEYEDRILLGQCQVRGH